MKVSESFFEPPKDNPHYGWSGEDSKSLAENFRCFYGLDGPDLFARKSFFLLPDKSFHYSYLYGRYPKNLQEYQQIFTPSGRWEPKQFLFLALVKPKYINQKDFCELPDGNLIELDCSGVHMYYGYVYLVEVINTTLEISGVLLDVANDKILSKPEYQVL